MVVTFDYDGTLRDYNGVDIHQNHRRLREHIFNGDRVMVVTRRHPEDKHVGFYGLDVINYVKRNFGSHIPVHFTYGDMKYAYLSRLGSELHYDDDPEEIRLIKQNTEIKTVKV